MNKQGAIELSEKAKELCKNGKFNQAISCYRQAIELDASCCDYYYQLGKILAQQEDKIPDAIDAYRKAITLNPNFSWSQHDLGQILHRQNRLDEAMECYRSAIALNPNFSWSHHFLAEILSKKGQIKLAIAHYRQAITLNPDFYISYYELGRNLQRKHQYQEAIDCYLNVIELKPNHFWSYYYLGNIFRELGQLAKAINYYQQAIELNPKYLQTSFCLGQILLDCGQKTIEDYRSSIKDQSKLFQVYFELGLGRSWQKKSNFAAAIDCYLKAIKIDPYQELPYQILQYIEIPPQKLNEIIIFYQELTDNIPSLDLAWGNLGDVLTQAGKLDEAIICYRNSCYNQVVNTRPKLANLNWAIKKQKAPNFIIIGAAKCGTSSLFSYLQQHPQVLLPYKKEIDFFNKHFDKGIDWYLAHFPVITDYENFITGEATTNYLFNSGVERRIYDACPDVKIIIMLRNPVNRTISDYYHFVNRGLETRSLKTIIGTSKKLLNKFKLAESEYVINGFDYISRSVYFNQIFRWMKIFPSSNILILNSDSFFENSASIMNNIWQFLQLDCYSCPTYIKYNVGTYPLVAYEIKQELEKLFKPYNQKLEEYLGKKFNW